MINFVFFGTPQLSADILERLKQDDFLPSLIVTNPDKPVGRKHILTPSPVKLWAKKNSIPILQPESTSDPAFTKQLATSNYELFVVVAFGSILTKEVLAIPEKGSLNLHYSLLPKYRGASPVETAILNDDKDVGVSILLLDEKMDHGPVVADRRLEIQDSGFMILDQRITWPPTAEELRKVFNMMGGDLLAETIPRFMAGEIVPIEQDHSKATYTKKIAKEDGEIKLEDDGCKNYLKYQAYKTWPGTFFYITMDGKKTRIKITEASFKDGKFIIERVIPEGKKETDYKSTGINS